MQFVCSRSICQLRLGVLFQRNTYLKSSCSAQPSHLANGRTWASSRSFSNCARYYRNDSNSVTNEASKNRSEEIRNAWPDQYPRLKLEPNSISCDQFRSKYDGILPNETVAADTVVIYGRIRSQRKAGSKLIFFDILHNGHKVQVLCNQRILEAAGINTERFKEFYHLLRRGDVFSVTGNPHRTSRGELTITANKLPKLMSPCRHDVPIHKKEQDISPYDRHVELLSAPGAADMLRARSSIVQHIRTFFLRRDFLEVNTPILASKSGGAIAQPFSTTATEFPDRQLSLRIAPELWLKRLVIGGFDKVFEIGSSFRNEGIDRTHNPEFTTCEFYQAFADLETLIEMTESLLSGLSNNIDDLNQKLGNTLNPIKVNFTGPYRRIDFIPAIEEAIGRKLPDLQSDNALAKLSDIFHDLSLPLPDHVNLPRLLDKLCSTYLESKCHEPTFIMNHPECMSPLSKSYIHQTCGQPVSARAELFVEGKEVMNMYEEENSPFEQRRKFETQLTYRDPENSGEIDESYLQALEWGLPPTGGWGGGIERLCMLFTGAQRIGDVLSFGNLRSVTGKRQGSESPAETQSEI